MIAWGNRDSLLLHNFYLLESMTFYSTFASEKRNNNPINKLNDENFRLFEFE